VKTFVSIVALALLPVAAAAADRPDWAFPSKSDAAVVTPPDDGQPKHVPGSTKSYTQKEIDSFNNPPDWFPGEHPPAPDIVAHGKGAMVRACISCHLSTGYGHPENSRLAGAPAAYLIRQIENFRSGVRKGEGAGNMINFSKSMTDEDAKAAAEYFASIKPARWTKVVETDTVPKTYFKGTRRLAHPGGGKEATASSKCRRMSSGWSFGIRTPASSPMCRQEASPRARLLSQPVVGGQSRAPSAMGRD
jgi:cytochrome c553